jgi:hypothetical protein
LKQWFFLKNGGEYFLKQKINEGADEVKKVIAVAGKGMIRVLRGIQVLEEQFGCMLTCEANTTETHSQHCCCSVGGVAVCLTQ